MLTAEQISQFDQDGFLKGEVVLSEEEVEILREELNLVMEGQSVKKPVLNRNMLDNSHYGMTITKKRNRRPDRQHLDGE